MAHQRNDDDWLSTACILCACNCGVKVQLDDDGKHIVRTKGDEAHPGSRGYVCNKASRLDYYQNGPDRLASPLRRNADGGYDEISWDVAIREIAAKLGAVRDDFGGESIFYYGGGGQGNHLPGAYARTTLSALGSRYRSNALAQEKTGEFWVADRMLGGYTHGDFENAEVGVFLGKNPWQSHGIARARVVLREIAKDPDRTLIIIDPKRTESADMADIHLAVKPARDAWLLAGMVATIVQEGLTADAWLAEHAAGVDAVTSVFADVDVAECARKCGVDEGQIRDTARLIARAKSAAFFEDLGTQMNRHSTLVSYLQRLVWLLCGHFGREGTAATPAGLGNIGGGKETGVSPVLGARLIAGLVPCNVVADEVLADHPNRYRAMIIESGNPVHSLAHSSRWREAMAALDVSVVIDVAMTETARHADYVLPATTQYEKAEATFFNFEFPHNAYHVRHPLFSPPAGVLDEAEIHFRLAEALGAIPDGIEAELCAVLEREGRAGFRDAVFAKLAENPSLMGVAPALLYRTLGRSLPDGLQNAATLWAICHQYALANAATLNAAGIDGEGMELGDALFDALIASPSGRVFRVETWDDAWNRLPGGKVQLELDDMLASARELANEEPQETSEAYPFLLAAGERRTYTANTIIRDPAWRKKDPSGALHIHPADAARLNLGEGSTARVSSLGGVADVLVSVNERMARGHVSLPNGMGLDTTNDAGEVRRTGTAPNELTWSDLRDEFVGTPWHKSVPVQIEAVEG